VAVALLVGLVGGAVVAVAAGARRTSSAYPRLVAKQKPLEVTVPLGSSVPAVPEVVEQAEFLELFPFLRGRTDAGLDLATQFLSADVAVTRNSVDYLSRSKLLQGWRLDPDKADEVVVGFDTAAKYRLHVGTRMQVVLARKADYPEFSRGAGSGAFIRLTGGLPVTLRVVGIEARAGQFPPAVLGPADRMYLTPAFYRAHGSELLASDNLEVRVEPGTLDEVLHRVAATQELDVSSVDTVEQHNAATMRAMHLPTLALWLLAALAGLAALLVIGQTLARQAFLEAVDMPVLRALGMTRGQIFGVGMGRAAVVAGAGAVTALIVAIAMSPLFPVGLARTAEPNPGLAVDWVALGLGAAGVFVFVVAAAALPNWRVSAPPSPARAEQRASGSAELLARNGFPPTAVTGVRLALERGRGRTAVPVASTLLAAGLGIAAVAAAVTFAAGLRHLLDTPRLYGWTWDVQFGDGYGPDQYDVAAGALDKIRDQVSGMDGGTVAALNINGTRIFTFAVQPLQGSIDPAIVDGRAAFGPDEIVLGTRALGRLGLHVGDQVQGRVVAVSYNRVPPPPARRLRIVGSAVVPETYEGRTSDGAFITYEGLTQLLGHPAARNLFFVKWAPGVHPTAALRRLGDLSVSSLPQERPVDLVNFGRVHSLPAIIAGLMAVVASAMLGHTLVTSVRRRRRDLAILKTLGFERHQVTTTVVWQATTTIALALMLGLPVGVATGRVAWRTFAGTLGVLPEPVVPLAPVLLAVPIAVLVANLLAAVPAFAAARMSPAVVLRAE